MSRHLSKKRMVAALVVASLAALGVGVPVVARAAATPTATAPAAATPAATTPAAATPAATTPAIAPATTGSLTLQTKNPVAGQSLTFAYTTDKPLDLNWVGVYDTPASGPTDQTYHAGSTAYAYTKDATTGDDTSGTITVSGAKLTAGHDITAYFLYDDGYTWLAQPVTFQVQAAATPSPTGSLTLETKNPVAGEPLTFSYSTDTPLALNWVGLYNDPADGPTDQKYHSSSTAYTYTGDAASGTLTVSGAGLTSGHDITAYFLYDDGYTWLAKPVTFRVTDPPPYDPTPTTAHFVTTDVTVAATPPVTSISTSVGGLWFGAGGTKPSAAVTFAKTAGPAWLKVSATGVITGTTPSSPSSVAGRTATVTVTATDAKGVSGSITVAFPLSTAKAKPTVKAATLSMWDGGSHVAGSQEKLIRSILANRLDVVGLQDTRGTQATAVAKLLGWGHVETSGGQAIVSRYPLAADPGVVPTGLPAVAAVANVGGSRVQVWSAALDSDAFGPAAACAAAPATAKAIIAEEKATLRFRQAQVLAKAITKTTTQRATRDLPNIVLADLESPGSGDWTRATSATHCGIGPVAWPVPALLTKAGLTDSFRAEFPSATKDSGQTTSIFPAVTTGAASTTDAATAASTSATGTSTTDGPERIDFVDFSGPLTVAESHTLVDGYPQGPTGTEGNAWISNRAAVVTTFTLGS